MGANLKLLFFLCTIKQKLKVIYFSVIQQVEPQSHAGEKTIFDSLDDHISIIQYILETVHWFSFCKLNEMIETIRT